MSAAAVDTAVLDTLTLARLVAEQVDVEGGAAGVVRSELDRIWLECAFVETGGVGQVAIMDRITGHGWRAPVEAAQVSAQVQAVARAQRDLDELAARHAVELEAATVRRDEAAAKLDDRRRALLSEHAERLRADASRLQVEAEGCGELDTEVVRVVTHRIDGSSTVEPVLRFRRDLLTGQAAAAREAADRLDRQAAPGALDGDALAAVVAGLVDLPGGG